jgi:hypothetical protein
MVSALQGGLIYHRAVFVEKFLELLLLHSGC